MARVYFFKDHRKRIFACQENEAFHCYKYFKYEYLGTADDSLYDKFLREGCNQQEAFDKVLKEAMKNKKRVPVGKYKTESGVIIRSG